MNTHTISRTAVNGYLRLARTPVDLAIGLLPGDPAAGEARKLAVDRADATARAVAAALLRDPQLRDDAQRRRKAAQERARALSLRAQARRTGEAADEHLDERHEQAEERRRRAAEQAKERRAAAARERRERTKRAQQTERKREQASRDVHAKVEDRIEEREPAERLEVVEAQAQAQREQETALAEQAEAQRLAEAAAALKEERSTDS